MDNKKNILVIGGAGFIGAHLCERLLSESNVICVDNFVTSSENNINHLLRAPNFKFIKADITEKLNLENNKELASLQLKVFGIQEVYNLACPTSVKNFEKLKLDTVRTQTLGLINALDIAVKYQARFLQASSSVVYGETHKDEFVKEDFQGISRLDDPRACYDEGKRYAETVVRTYAEIKGLEVRTIRFFRTYGPKMLLDDGQMIPDFIINALENKNLTIYGTKDFTTSLCYVSDAVEGCLKVMRSDIKEPVNVGSTDVYKIGDIAEKIIDLTNSKSEIKTAEKELFMRELALPDITKIKEDLGWIPVVTLEDGLQKTIDFTKAHKNLLTFSTDI